MNVYLKVYIARHGLGVDGERIPCKRYIHDAEEAELEITFS